MEEESVPCYVPTALRKRIVLEMTMTQIRAKVHLQLGEKPRSMKHMTAQQQSLEPFHETTFLKSTTEPLAILIPL
jgi:hypothetical protein